MSWDWEDLGGRIGPHGSVRLEAPGVQREAELEETYQRGFQDGEASGLNRALQELDPSRQAAEKAASQLAVLHEELTNHTQENVLALALVVARKVLEKEIRAAPETVADLVEKALTHFPLDQKVRVRLNPADLTFVSGESSDGTPPEAVGREVRWTPDETVSPGGCIVEGPEHVVDGRLDTALERLYRTVFHD